MSLRCCNKCQSSNGEFNEAVNLKKSRLTIYIHEDKSKQKVIGADDRRSIILYNAGDRELRRFDYIVELCCYETKCLKCMAIIQRVRNLLEDITSIRKHEVLGICEYCKRSNMRNKCKRCEYIVNKFIHSKLQESKDEEKSFMAWLSIVQRVLISIMQGQVICKHNNWLNYKSKIELDNVLQHLKLSLPVKQPNIEVYPDRICLQNSESNIVMKKIQILDELLLKLKADNKININIEQIINDSVSESGSSCICKQLKNDNIKTSSTPPFEMLSNNFTKTTKLNDKQTDCIRKQLTLSHIKENENQSIMKEVVLKQKISRTETKKTKQIEKKDLETKYKKKNMADNEDIKHEELYTTKENVNKKQKSYSTLHSNTKNIKKFKNAEVKKQYSFYQLMRKMMKEKNIEKIHKEKYTEEKKNKKVPVTVDLPIINTTIKTKVEREDSGNTIECNGTPDHPVTEIIKGSKIVQYDSHDKENSEMKTRLFKISADCTTPILEIIESVVKDNSITKEPVQADVGVMFYKLSDRKFIENGWTQLPMTKMRRMNIYKMITCNDAYDWFKCHKEQNALFYDSGRKLAEVSENGFGKWFYENGDIALDYYNVTDAPIPGKRYIIYSSSEENCIINKKELITVLGCFDSLGNGVVYDYCGNVRLKYNQSEGLVIDKKVGPPGRWKWHALNEPPVLQPVYLDTKITEDPCLRNFVEETNVPKKPNEQMIAIEHDKFLKERATKMFHNYKPFEIRMKAVKINESFSLRIINQSKINLLFRYGRNHLRQNMGMALKCDEIIDTEIIEIGDVPTPYDRQIPKSKSIAAVQNVLLKSKRIKH